MDDDPAIHKLWSGRWKNFPESQFVSIALVAEFEEWIRENRDRENFCLIDQEIEPQAQRGIDLILKYQLNSHALLVTSRADDPAILQQALQNKIKVLAKSQVSWIPLEIT